MGEESYNINAFIQSTYSDSSIILSQVVSDTPTFILATDRYRKRLVICNGNKTCYISLAVIASPSVYSYKLTPNATLELEHYRGELSAVIQEIVHI